MLRCVGLPEFHYISINLSVFEDAILFTSPFLISFLTLKKSLFGGSNWLCPTLCQTWTFTGDIWPRICPRRIFLDAGSRCSVVEGLSLERWPSTFEFLYICHLEDSAVEDDHDDARYVKRTNRGPEVLWYLYPPNKSCIMIQTLYKIYQTLHYAAIVAIREWKHYKK